MSSHEGAVGLLVLGGPDPIRINYNCRTGVKSTSSIIAIDLVQESGIHSFKFLGRMTVVGGADVGQRRKSLGPTAAADILLTITSQRGTPCKP